MSSHINGGTNPIRDQLLKFLRDKKGRVTLVIEDLDETVKNRDDLGDFLKEPNFTLKLFKTPPGFYGDIIDNSLAYITPIRRDGYEADSMHLIETYKDVSDGRFEGFRKQAETLVCEATPYLSKSATRSYR